MPWKGWNKVNINPLPEIGDILRPRSIWHAVSNYQDGGINKAVRRKKTRTKMTHYQRI